MTRKRADRADMIVRAIDRHTSRFGYAPSVREIMREVGLSSPAAVHHHLTALRKAGRLLDSEGQARAWVVAKRPDVDADAIELAWCLSVHGSRPPKVRPCKRHRVMAEWLTEIVLPRARELVSA